MGQRYAFLAGLVILANLSCAPNTGGAKGPGGAATPAPTVPPVGTVAPPSAPAGAGTPQSTTSGSPTAAAPSAPPQGGPPPGGQGGAPGAGRGGRPQLTPEQNIARRDSLATMRTGVVQQLMQRIAGYENKRSADEYTNVTLMKDTTAAQLLKVMDSYGAALSVGCSYCHVDGGKWDEDTKEEKKTTRVMIQLVNSINNEGLSKLPPNRGGQTPKISCVTCHRGRTTPGRSLLP